MSHFENINGSDNDNGNDSDLRLMLKVKLEVGQRLEVEMQIIHPCLLIWAAKVPIHQG